MSLLDQKSEPISPKRVFEICEGCEVATDKLIYVPATPGEMAHIFHLALNSLAHLALEEKTK